jgi:hypothetical protein
LIDAQRYADGNADTYKIYDSDYKEILGEKINAVLGTLTFYVEAIRTDCNCVSERVAVHVTVVDTITFDLPTERTFCTGIPNVDLKQLVAITNPNIRDYTVEVRNASGDWLTRTQVNTADTFPVRVKSGGCYSEVKKISILESTDNKFRIIEQPTDQVYNSNPDANDYVDFVNFYVVAEGSSEIAYQWFKIESGVTTRLEGETNPKLSVSRAEISSNGCCYYVEVYCSCGNGTASIKSDIVCADHCRLVIIQKKNHTLMVDNSGYSFVHYEWYRNDTLLHKGTHGMDLGGMYNTGRINLNPADTYYAIATDQNGKKHRTCIYNPVIHEDRTRIIAYPNPTPKSSSLIVVDVETNDEELRENGVVFAYNIAGQYIGQVRTRGHRITPVQLPSVAGVYILKFVSGEFEKAIKIVVE